MDCLGKGFFAVFLTSLITSCTQTRTGVILSPTIGIWQPSWSREELQKDFVVRKLHVSDETSHHIIYLKTAEKPHVHKDHDLTVFVLKGQAIMHLGEQLSIVNAGDVIEIPRGVVHWAENLDISGSQVYAIFNPPFNGKDHHPVSALPPIK